jgi:hypothetical protein
MMKMNSVLRQIALLIIIFTFCACGSITKTTSIIRINSKEAGTLVSITDDEDQTTKVTSPALVGVAPGSSFKSQWSQRGEPKKQTAKHSCDWQWGKSIIPNTLPVFGGLPGVAIALMFNGIDYFSGNIFDCSQLISKTGFKNKKKKKVRAFVIPPRLNDAKESLKIAKHFSSNKTNSKKITVIDPVVSKDALANLGINNNNAPANNDLPFERLRKYALKARAEYAVLLTIKKQQGRDQIIVTPKLINLISEKVKTL